MQERGTRTRPVEASRQRTALGPTKPLSPTQQPVHPILKLQQTIGNQSVQRLLCSGRLQAKLTISQPGDIYEQEADRVADQVMASASVPSIQRKCPACAEGAPCPECEEETIQTKELPGHVPQVTPKVESSLTSLRGGGQPLAPSVRAFFEPRFGRDFSQVRVHIDAAAAKSARALDARAFTLGQDVVFGLGKYQPGSGEGRRLLAHELAHIQQQQASPSLARQVMRTPYAGCDRATTGVGDADDRIDGAREQALNMIGAARAAFPRMSSRTIRNVDRHFHCPSSSQIRVIMRVLEAIEAAIPTLLVQCEDASADFCRESEYVRGQVTDGLVELCPASFRPDARAYRLAGTFIHAGAITAGMTNICMKRDACYDDFTLRADTMVGNSYSYTW